MPDTLFVSDLHLAPEQPGLLRLFEHFLAERAAHAAALYILGDLFDRWIGDDDRDPHHEAVRAALRQLAARGVACALLRGNRDFLLGRQFAAETGCRLLPDPCRIRVAGEPVLLTHGDLLCTDDHAYQRFRAWVRNPLVQRLCLWQSLARRQRLAEEYRQRGAAAVADKPLAIMDANPDAARRRMRAHRVLRLVHGHTHRPADHAFLLHNQPAMRQVLAAWTPKRGEFLVATAAGHWYRERVVAKQSVVSRPACCRMP